MNAAKIVKILIGLIIVLSLGFWLFAWGFGYGYHRGQNDAKVGTSVKTPEEVAQQLANIVSQSPVTSLFGRITSVSDGQLEISTSQLNGGLGAKSTPTKRLIKFTASTTIKIVTPKERKKLDEELNAFMLQIQKQSEGKISPTSTDQKTSPLPYTEINGKISDLKVDNNIEIMTDNDIRYATEITPTKIRIIQ
ncbi:MAG: hypothetical protein WC516_07685 [Patescibacteria group bacterium]